MAERVAVCPGSFDPLTNGHVEIIERGLKLFDHIVVAVSVNIRKTPLFSDDERMNMIRVAFDDEPRVSVDQLEGLLADYAVKKGAVALLRGLRAPSDFEYELRMSQMNRHLQPEVDSCFLIADPAESYVHSSLVKEVAKLGGDVSQLVPPNVLQALNARFGR